MKHRYHPGNPNAAGKEGTKVRALIIELDRRVGILESDIAREEDLAGVSNPSSAGYPAPARMMAAQCDNLKQTIAALEQRLAPELAQSA